MLVPRSTAPAIAPSPLPRGRTLPQWSPPLQGVRPWPHFSQRRLCSPLWKAGSAHPDRLRRWNTCRAKHCSHGGVVRARVPAGPATRGQPPVLDERVSPALRTLDEERRLFEQLSLVRLDSRFQSDRAGASGSSEQSDGLRRWERPRAAGGHLLLPQPERRRSGFGCLCLDAAVSASALSFLDEFGWCD